MLLMSKSLVDTKPKAQLLGEACRPRRSWMSLEVPSPKARQWVKRSGTLMGLQCGVFFSSVFQFFLNVFFFFSVFSVFSVFCFLKQRGTHFGDEKAVVTSWSVPFGKSSEEQPLGSWAVARVELSEGSAFSVLE